jgi:gliding motility-associated-like protein
MKTLAKENLFISDNPIIVREEKKMKKIFLLIVFAISVVFANGQTICTSSATSVDGADITNVSFGTINNSSALVSLAGSQGTASGTAGMYSDWCSSVPAPSLMQGSMQTFSVTIGSITQNSHSINVFFDYNHDGDFIDADEKIPVFAYSNPTLPSTTSVSINIPITAATGNTVMRVVCIESHTSPACGTYSYGETEDYLINITAAPACNGAPAPGNTVASISSVCSGETFTLSLSGTLTNTGLTYQWQSSADGIGWMNIPGATSATCSTLQTADTYYHCIVSCTAGGLSGTSASILVSMNSFIDCFCPSYSESDLDKDITNVTLGTINNTSALVSLAGSQGTATGTAGLYSDWKSSTVPIPSIMQGTTSALSVTVEWDLFGDADRVDVFIDFNHDGEFTISNESFPISPYGFYPGTSYTTTANLTIPLTALTGNTVMRVVCMEETTTFFPCGNYWFGETEDYLINITAAPLCSGTPTGGTTTASISAACSGNTGEISVTGSDAAYGLSYQWYSSPVAGGPWTLIPGATEETYSPTTYGLYFHREIICTGSGLSSNSTSFLYNSSSPVNDECSNATSLTVNPSTTCTAVMPGTTECASASSTPISCSVIAENDVWFKFVATSTTHIISILNAAGTTTDMFHAVYSGTCGFLTCIRCSDDDESTFSDLVIGQTYYVRVWTSTTGAVETTTFEVCVTTIPPPAVLAQYTNLGFECGFAGWYGTAGHSIDGEPGAASPVYIPVAFNTTSTTQHTIMTSGIDPYGLFPLVYSGNSSLRIGNDAAGETYAAGSIEQTFSVTAANTDFSYSYAVVLNDGGHEDARQPYFEVGVYDQTGAEITSGMYLMVAPGTGYIQSAVPTGAGYDVYYKPWSTVSVNLSSYVGQNVTIRIIASHCSWDICFAYAYIDFAYPSFEINTDPNPAVICSGEPVTLTAPAGAISYLWSTGEYTQSIIVYPAITTTYTCTVTTYGITACPDVLSTSVMVNSNVTPNFTQLGPYCVGATPDILPTTSNNGITGTWNALINTASAGTTVYTFSPTAGSCAATATMSVVVNSSITPVFTQLGPYCVGATPDILPSTSNNGIIGTWSPAIIDNLSSGTYTFTPDAGQCATNQVLNVTITPQLIPDFASITAFCSGSVAPVLGSTSPNGISGTWSPAIINNLSSGTYTFTPDAGECATIQTLNVTVNQTPVLTLVSTICSTNMLTYTATFTSTVGTITTTSGTLSGSTVTGIPAGTDIMITSTNNGCVTTLDVSAPNCACPTINPPTNPNNPSICEGDATPALTVDAAAVGFQINWYALSSGGAALATNSNSYTPNDITAGTYTYYAETEETVSGCTSIRIAVVLTINSNPITSVTETDVLCFGGSTGSIDLSVIGGTPNYTFDWSNGPATEDLTAIASGVYSVTITDANGCTSLTSVTVNEPAQIVATTAATAILCNGGTSVVTVTATNGIVPYSGTGTFTETAGTYNYTVTDANGCAVTTTVIISEPAILTLSVTASVNQNCSLPGSATVEGTGGTAPYAYTWPASANGVTAGTATSLTAGSYVVTVTDANGCMASANVFIGEMSEPVVSVSSQNDACRQGNGTATAIASGGDGNYTYLWSSNPPQTTAIATGLTAGHYTVTVYSGMCSATATITVNSTLGPMADISLSPSTTTIMDGPVDFSGSSSDNIVDWQWSFGDGSSGNGQTVQYQYTNIGVFIVTLIVTDDNGCTYTVTDSVVVKDIFTLYIPNAFTPDNDGNNDLFMPQGLNVDPDSYVLQIFDRWGNLIFETNTWGEGWNGTKDNLGSWEDAVQGAYVYKITAKTNEAHKRLHDYVGTVVIIK